MQDASLGTVLLFLLSPSSQTLKKYKTLLSIKELEIMKKKKSLPKALFWPVFVVMGGTGGDGCMLMMMVVVDKHNGR